MVVAADPAPAIAPPTVRPSDTPPVKGAANKPPNIMAPLAMPAAPPTVLAIPVLLTNLSMWPASDRRTAVQLCR